MALPPIRRTPTLLMGGLIAAGPACLLLGLMMGGRTISPAALGLALFQDGEDEVTRSILFDIRLPRVLLAYAIGAGLAMTGAACQAILRNPLAEPYILGVSGGAAVGAMLASLLGLPLLAGQTPVAFLFGIGAAALVVRLATRRFRLNPHRLILAGVLLNTLCSACLLLVFSFWHMPQAQTLFFWLMGNLGQAPLGVVLTALPLLGALFLLLGLFSHRLNLLVLGEEAAQSAGISVRRESLVILGLVSLITSVSVSLAGLIGFVGLIVPHALRRLAGGDHRRLMPASALSGGALLCLCDTLSRSLVPPVELPVGAITAALGVPFVFWLLNRDARDV